MAGEDLRRQHGARRSVALDARAEHEVGLARGDGGGEPIEVGDDIRAVAIHVDEDVRGGEGGVRAGKAGGAVAAGRLDDARTFLPGDGCGGVGRPVVNDDTFGDLVPRHFGDDMADRFGFVEGGDDDGDLGHGSEHFLARLVTRCADRPAFNDTITSRDSSVYGFNNRLEMRADRWPLHGQEFDDRNAPLAQVLLIAYVSVACEEQVETGLLGEREQFPVVLFRPAHRQGEHQVVMAKRRAQSPRQVLIEEYLHVPCSQCIYGLRSG